MNTIARKKTSTATYLSNNPVLIALTVSIPSQIDFHLRVYIWPRPRKTKEQKGHSRSEDDRTVSKGERPGRCGGAFTVARLAHN